MARTKKKIQPEIENSTKFETDDLEPIYMSCATVKTTKEELLKIANAMKAWADTDEALTLNGFFVKYKILKGSFYRWMERNDDLKAALDYTLQAIANRREIGAITGKYNANAIMPYMAMWDKSFKEHAEWRAELASKYRNPEANETKVVVIEKYPESPLVPKREEE